MKINLLNAMMPMHTKITPLSCEICAEQAGLREREDYRSGEKCRRVLKKRAPEYLPLASWTCPQTCSLLCHLSVHLDKRKMKWRNWTKLPSTMCGLFGPSGTWSDTNRAGRCDKLNMPSEQGNRACKARAFQFRMVTLRPLEKLQN